MLFVTTDDTYGIIRCVSLKVMLTSLVMKQVSQSIWKTGNLLEHVNITQLLPSTFPPFLQFISLELLWYIICTSAKAISLLYASKPDLALLIRALFIPASTVTLPFYFSLLHIRNIFTSFNPCFFIISRYKHIIVSMSSGDIMPEDLYFEIHIFER